MFEVVRINISNNRKSIAYDIRVDKWQLQAALNHFLTNYGIPHVIHNMNNGNEFRVDKKFHQ